MERECQTFDFGENYDLIYKANQYLQAVSQAFMIWAWFEDQTIKVVAPNLYNGQYIL